MKIPHFSEADVCQRYKMSQIHVQTQAFYITQLLL